MPSQLNEQSHSAFHHHAELIIRGGTAILPNGPATVDIACRDGMIAQIGQLSHQWTADDIIDASGLHVLPGVIDTQVHFREPGLTHKETIEAGSCGAVMGGVTTFFEMPNTCPLTLGREDLENKLSLAHQYSWCDHAFFVGASAQNVDTLDALEKLPGCAGVKIFMGSSFGSLLVDDDCLLDRIMENGQRRVSVHAEDEARLTERKHLAENSGNVQDHPVWRDVTSALMATRKIVGLAEKHQRPLHVLHVSSEEELTLLANHRRYISVEVTPHHLTLEAPYCYETLGSLAQMNPPIRDGRHRVALWEAITQHRVDVIGSDHAPHTLEEKHRPYPSSPSGLTGVQTLLPIMLDHVNAGRLTLEQLVDLASKGPAGIFGIKNKGAIQTGFDADLVVVDMKATRIIDNDWIASKSGWTPYHGRPIKGWPIHTVLRGHPVVRQEKIVGRPRGEPVKFFNS